MKIAIVYPYFNKRGGIERHIYELVSELSVLNDVWIVCSKIECDLPPNVQLLLVPNLNTVPYLREFLFTLLSTYYTTKNKFDIVHTHGASSFSQNIITAHSCHKAWFLKSLFGTRFFSKPWLLKLLNPIHYITILTETIQYQFGNFNQIIAVSDSVKNDLVTYYSINENNITTIYNGVRLQEFQSVSKFTDGRMTRSRLNISDNEFVALFVGNEFKRKGLAILLNAISLIHSDSIKLLIVGNDSYASFNELAKKLNIADKCIYIGYTTRLNNYFAASDCMVLPTSYEPFGMVAIEAMASGTPVIISNIDGPREFIINDENGILINDFKSATEIAGHIVKLMTNKDLYKRIAEHGIQTSSGFSWELIANKTITIYLSIENHS